jgi:hypothetical protein
MDEPNRKRRWYQFRLRTLMIFVLISAIPCALLGRKFERKRHEREIVDSIKKAGGTVLYEYELDPGTPPPGPEWLRRLLGDDFFANIDSASFDRAGDSEVETLEGLTELRGVIFNAGNFSERGLSNLKELKNLESLDFLGSQVSDDGVACLGTLSQLESLSFFEAIITDAGLAKLSGLVHLTKLHLTGTTIGDAGIRSLKAPALKVLGLDGTKVTDEGLNNVAQMALLEDLRLTATEVSDGGIPYLKRLRNLKRLAIRKTRISDAGAADLQESLPSCKIYR